MMKTMTMREFYRSPGLAQSLQPGQSVMVTDHGKPSLLVTKTGKRPRRTVEQLKAEAVGAPGGKKYDIVKVLAKLR
jgi:hypothetical protein